MLRHQSILLIIIVMLLTACASATPPEATQSEPTLTEAATNTRVPPTATPTPISPDDMTATGDAQLAATLGALTSYGLTAEAGGASDEELMGLMLTMIPIMTEVSANGQDTVATAIGAAIPTVPTSTPDARATEIRATTTAMFARITGVCQGEKIPEAAAYSAASSPHLIQYIDESPGLEGHRAVEYGADDEWLAQDVESLQLVACVETSETEIEKCQYSGAAGTFTLSRIISTVRIRLIAVVNGSEIAQNTFTGYPVACPNFATDRSNIVGYVTYDMVHPWIAAYVNP